jgi:23S rRNA pseudouridine1911/1915/1917 synthase
VLLGATTARPEHTSKMPEKAVRIQSARERRPRPEPEELPVRIVYEDDALIAVDKPPGMVVHPTYRNWSATLLNGLLWHVRNRAGVTPRILTRLDKDTSGLVLAALAGDVQARIQKDTAGGGVTKEYLAVVRGTPSPATGTIDLPLARSSDDRRLVVVTPDGQRSETRYEVLSSAGDVSLVRCELVTGRTHQIRVHLAARGWPLLGDPTYGVPDSRIARQALHAWRITLPHPVSGKPLRIEVPPPTDLQQFFPVS